MKRDILDNSTKILDDDAKGFYFRARSLHLTHFNGTHKFMWDSIQIHTARSQWKYFFKLSPESLIESWKADKSRHIAHFLRIWNISKLKFWSLFLCFGSLCYSSVDLNPFSLHLSLLSSLYFSSAPAAGASLLSCAINFSNAFLFLLELAQSPSWCLTDFFPLKESSLSLQWTKFFRWCY